MSIDIAADHYAFGVESLELISGVSFLDKRASIVFENSSGRGIGRWIGTCLGTGASFSINSHS